MNLFANQASDLQRPSATEGAATHPCSLADGVLGVDQQAVHVADIQFLQVQYRRALHLRLLECKGEQQHSNPSDLAGSLTGWLAGAFRSLRTSASATTQSAAIINAAAIPLAFMLVRIGQRWK